MFKPFAVALCVALTLGAGATALATKDPFEEQKAQARYGLFVQGKIVVGSAGMVTSFEIDHADKMQPSTRAFIEKQIKRWRFEDGEGITLVAPVQSGFNMHIMGEPIGEDEISLQARQPFFHSPEMNAVGLSITANRLPPPTYPSIAARSDTSGIVYLAVKVARTGEVLDAAPIQVNLRNYGPPSHLERVRRALAKASVETALKEWVFAPLSTDYEQPFATVVVPVDFSSLTESAPWDWQAYIPGPKQVIPWETPQFNAAVLQESTPAGSLYMPVQKPGRIRLVTADHSGTSD